ncbi:FMNH2-dependent monooxygenase, partial [Mycobacterium rufum]|nr:FMNH2-dependent monooxygenase [Mycolicibacterium rufum]
DLLTPRYWVDLVAQAERGHLDFVTIEDAFTLQNDLPSSAASRPTG